jgi:hypothetical protein
MISRTSHQARRSRRVSPILRTVGQAYVSDPPIFWMVIQFIRSILLDFSTNNCRSVEQTFDAHRVAVMHKSYMLSKVDRKVGVTPLNFLRQTF